MLITHDKPMGKEIKLRINACYGDLRPSEKKAADYVLKHLDELKTLTLDRLAENVGVSQPTVMRMIKSLGYGGYKEFRYAVVEKLAAGSNNTAGFEAMYGYTLTGKEKLEDIPAKIVATTGSMAGEMLKNISMKTFSRVIEKLKDAQVMLVDMIYMALLASDYKKYVKALNRNGHVAMDKAYLP